MTNSKKYYFLKLKEDFFRSREMIVLESMTDGILYSNLLLKMYLLSLQYEGYLMLNDGIPLNTEMLSHITNHEIGTVERGIKLLMEMGMVELMEDGGFFMTDIPKLIGQSTLEADRKALERRAVHTLSEDCPKSVRVLSKNRPTEYRDKSIENRDKILEGERIEDKNAPTPPSHPPEYKYYGKYSNVELSEEQFKDLSEKYPDDYERMIKHFSEYMHSHGKDYHNHYDTILRWKQEDEENEKNKDTGKNRYVYDNSHGEGESL